MKEKMAKRIRLTGVAAVVLAGFVLTAVAEPVSAQTKVALLINNSNYVHAPPLQNPKKDAAAISKVLQAIGFSVFQLEDAKKSDFEGALAAFGSNAAAADIAIIYYAGHAIQVSGTNYLIPVEAQLDNETDVRRLVPAEDMLKDAARAKRLAVVIFDACRDNPFLLTLAESLAGRSVFVDRGLARMSAVPRDTLIAYSTQAGNVALDGEGENSPYAIALLQHLPALNKDIRMVFGSVRDSVLEQTSQRQEPFIYGSLGGIPLYLNTDASVTVSADTIVLRHALAPVLVAPTASTALPAKKQAAPIREDFAAWQDAKQTNDWAKISALKEKYPASLYALIADKMLRIQSTSAPGMPVQVAIGVLKREPLLVPSLPRKYLTELQKALRDTNYYSGDTKGTADTATMYATVEAFTAFSEDVFAKRSLSYETLLALREYGDQETFSDRMSGRWKGRYYYSRPLEGVTDVPFEMNLVLSQGHVSGFLSEPNTFNKKSRTLHANLDGTILGNSVSWTKTYDGTGSVDHAVYYSGILDRKQRRIQGEWKIKEDWRGPFVIDLAPAPN